MDYRELNATHINKTADKKKCAASKDRKYHSIDREKKKGNKLIPGTLNDSQYYFPTLLVGSQMLLVTHTHDSTVWL